MVLKKKREGNGWESLLKLLLFVLSVAEMLEYNVTTVKYALENYEASVLKEDPSEFYMCVLLQ